MRLNQGWNPPERDYDEHQQNSTNKLKSSGYLPVSRVHDYHTDSQQWCPSNRAFGKETERKRQIKNKEGRFPNRPRRFGGRRSLVLRCALGVGRWALKKLVSCPMRDCHEQHEPHIGDRGFCVNEGLERKSKNNCSPPAELFSAHAATPEEDR